MKIIRYYVAIHIGKYGQPTLRGWDVRRVVKADEDCFEREGGVEASFKTRKDAANFAANKNRKIKI